MKLYDIVEEQAKRTCFNNTKEVEEEGKNLNQWADDDDRSIDHRAYIRWENWLNQTGNYKKEKKLRCHVIPASRILRGKK